jgi:hypothetical protein
MRRQGGGFGIVVMLVVLAVIFYLVMNNFKSTAPSALQIQRHNAERKARREVNAEQFDANQPPTSASSDAWTPTPPSRPSLDTVDKNTTAHSNDVQNALSQAN